MASHYRKKFDELVAQNEAVLMNGLRLELQAHCGVVPTDLPPELKAQAREKALRMWDKVIRDEEALKMRAAQIRDEEAEKLRFIAGGRSRQKNEVDHNWYIVVAALHPDVDVRRCYDRIVLLMRRICWKDYTLALRRDSLRIVADVGRQCRGPTFLRKTIAGALGVLVDENGVDVVATRTPRADIGKYLEQFPTDEERLADERWRHENGLTSLLYTGGVERDGEHVPLPPVMQRGFSHAPGKDHAAAATPGPEVPPQVAVAATGDV